MEVRLISFSEAGACCSCIIFSTQRCNGHSGSTSSCGWFEAFEYVWTETLTRNPSVPHSVVRSTPCHDQNQSPLRTNNRSRSVKKMTPLDSVWQRNSSMRAHYQCINLFSHLHHLGIHHGCSPEAHECDKHSVQFSWAVIHIVVQEWTRKCQAIFKQ